MQSTLPQVILFSLIGGLFSLAAAICLLGRKKLANQLAKVGIPFAAGALLAAVFGDLLPESVDGGFIESALMWTLMGILVFFGLEYSFRWFHHHHGHKKENAHITTMAIIGDTLHNALDGVAIAVAFLLSPQAGIVTTLAVAAHEIPQEIGDFGLLLAAGMSRKKILIFNIISSLATTIAAIITFQLGSENELPLGALVGLSSGFLLYIAVADLIPTIHDNAKDRKISPVILLLLGVFTVLLAIRLADNFVGSRVIWI